MSTASSSCTEAGLQVTAGIQLAQLATPPFRKFPVLVLLHFGQNHESRTVTSLVIQKKQAQLAKFEQKPAASLPWAFEKSRDLSSDLL